MRFNAILWDNENDEVVYEEIVETAENQSPAEVFEIPEDIDFDGETMTIEFVMIL